MAILIAGAAAGAAGDPVIAGGNNSSGAAQTILSTTAFGASFTLKNTTNGQTGQFGWSSGTAGTGRGLYGRADSPDGFGVDAFNNAAGFGNGAALRARGGSNFAILATSTGNSAIDATSESGFGIRATGAGFATAVYGDGTGSFAGVWGVGNPDVPLYGTVGTNTAIDGIGVYASSSDGAGVLANGEGAGSIDFDCSGPSACYDWPGGAFAANIGVIGQTDGLGPEGYSRGVLGIANGGGFYGVFSVGDAYIQGNLNVTGTCTGCTLAALGQNASKQAIRQGDAVTLTGVATAEDGSIILLVAPAKKGDTIFGIADTSVSLSAATVTTKPISHKEPQLGKKEPVTVTEGARTVAAKDRKWLQGGATTASSGFLRIVTSGVLAYDAGTSLTAAVGDRLAVGATVGKLSKAQPDAAKGTVVGTFLGKLKDGRTVLLVSPS
jgi:hypothetical protein